MRGHEPIIAMRIEGTTPTIVFINDFPCDSALDWNDPGEKFGEDWPTDHATVSTAGDMIAHLDMRFLVGLTVVISSECEDRAKALFAKAKWFGAKFVVASHVQPTHPYFQTGWVEIFQKDPTNG